MKTVDPDQDNITVFTELYYEISEFMKTSGPLFGEQAWQLTQEQLQQIPAMIREMEEARKQLQRYRDDLEKKHGNLRLRRYAVAALGFERIWWEEAVQYPASSSS